MKTDRAQIEKHKHKYENTNANSKTGTQIWRPIERKLKNINTNMKTRTQIEKHKHKYENTNANSRHVLRSCFWICVCEFAFAFVFLPICVCVFEFAFVFLNLRLCFWICVRVFIFVFLFLNLRRFVFCTSGPLYFIGDSICWLECCYQILTSSIIISHSFIQISKWMIWHQARRTRSCFQTCFCKNRKYY